MFDEAGGGDKPCSDSRFSALETFPMYPLTRSYESFAVRVTHWFTKYGMRPGVDPLRFEIKYEESWHISPVK